MKSAREQDRRTQLTDRGLADTPHPSWLVATLDDLADDWNGLLESPLFRVTVAGTFPEQAWRRAVLDYFGVVEALPKYMGLYLGRTRFGRSDGDTIARNWLIGSIQKEALYVEWFVEWGLALGLSRDEIINHRAGLDFAALQESLWSIAHNGSLAESIFAINYAVAGITGEWSRMVLPKFRERFCEDGHAVRWLSDNADFAVNSGQALELVKMTALEWESQCIGGAAKLSLQLLRRGFDACYTQQPGM